MPIGRDGETKILAQCATLILATVDAGLLRLAPDEPVNKLCQRSPRGYNRRMTIAQAELRKLLILVAIAVYVGGIHAATAEQVALGWGSADAAYSVWFYAQEKGYFRKHGLETTLVGFDSGAKGVQGLVGGSVDIEAADGNSVVNARLAGVDLRLIGTSLGVLSGEVFVAKDIISPEQLKGKKWGISSFGSEAHMAEQVALRAFGLADSDVTTVQVGNVGNRFAALEAGQIQASTFQLPMSAKVKAAGYPVLAELPQLAPDYMSFGPTVMASTLRDRRPMIKAFLEAMAEATVALKKDRVGTVDILKKYLHTSDADATAAWDYYAPLYPASMRPTASSVQFYLDRSSNPEAKTLKPEDVYDLSTLDELEQAGFFKSLN